MADPIFLTLAEVIEIHSDQIRRYGGQEGLRDRSLLESALAQPESSFGGEWLHPDLLSMAAAYAYHICQNRCFIDGNKRAALVCALVFLEMNAVTLLDPRSQLKDAMLHVASGKMEKEALESLFHRLAKFSRKE